MRISAWSIGALGIRFASLFKKDDVASDFHDRPEESRLSSDVRWGLETLRITLSSRSDVFEVDLVRAGRRRVRFAARPLRQQEGPAFACRRHHVCRRSTPRHRGNRCRRDTVEIWIVA